MNLIIAIFALLFLILALKRLDWAILLLLAALPTYLVRFQIGPLPSTLLEIMILIAFAVWFFKIGRPWEDLKNWKGKDFRRPNYPFHWLIILILIITYLAIIPAHFKNDALGIFKAYFFEPILLFILIINTFKDGRSYAKIFWALSISAFFIAAWAIIQKVSGQFVANPFWANPQNFRAVSFYGYPNAVGLYLGPLVVLLSAFFFSLLKDRGFKLHKSLGLKMPFLALSILMSLAAIWFARSDGALAALAITAFILLLVYGRRTRYLAFGLVIFASLALAFLPGPRDYIWEKARLESLSGRIRQLQWKETYEMLSDGRLIMGAGLNQYPSVLKPYHQDGFFFNRDHLDNFDQRLRVSAELRNKYWQPVEIYQYPHNIFLNFWTETGLLGALVFSWLIIKLLILSVILAIRFKKQESAAERLVVLGLFGTLLMIVLHGLVDVPYFKNDLAAFFWLIVALLGIFKLKNNAPNLAKTDC